MNSLRKIVKDERSTFEIRGLIEVYEQIAASKMQKIREDVVTSQEYFDGLAAISDEVALDLNQYFNEKVKPAAIFLSADTGLYGDIIDKVMVNFVDFVKKGVMDAFVAGKLGVSLIRSYDPTFNFVEVEFPGESEKVGESDLTKIMSKLSPYSKIYIFHGRFQSIARQTSASSTISGADVEKYGASLSKKELQKRRLTNIYEPDVRAISDKFGKEISASILDQTVKENQLAKYAARLIHLDGAFDTISKRLEDLNANKKRMRKRIEQKKQTERIARWQRL